MTNNQDNNLGQRAPLPTRGLQVVQAAYFDALIPDYRGNPCIEALPPIITKSETIEILEHIPEYSEKYRAWPAELRLHLVQTLSRLFLIMPHHWDLEQRISRMLRAGYVNRNPVTRGYFLDAVRRAESIQPGSEILLTSYAPTASSAALGFNILGISGIGKSTALNAVLSLYPQVIIHNSYGGKEFHLTQVVWLKLDCPHDGSLRGLCFAFFQELDRLLNTNYYVNYARKGRASKDEMLAHMARLVGLHSIGGLFIDEIQILTEMRNNSGHMLNFFVQLYNTVGVPTVLVGTYKAMALLAGEFRQARRGSGQGDFVWDRMQQDKIWDEFVESMWEYQYTMTPSPLTADLKKALFQESQGITDFVVKLYMLAQARAIAARTEKVTVGLIRSTAQECLRLARPVLEALKRNDFRALQRMEDVYIDFQGFLDTVVQTSDAQQRGAEIPEGNLAPAAPPPSSSSTSGEMDQDTKLSTGEPGLASPGESALPGAGTPVVGGGAGDEKPSPKRKSTTSKKGAKGGLQDAVAGSPRTADDILKRVEEAGYIVPADEYLNDDLGQKARVI